MDTQKPEGESVWTLSPPGADPPRPPERAGIADRPPSNPPYVSDALALDVLFFASYRDLVGTPESTVHLSPGATVAQLVDHLRDRGDGFEQLPTHPAVAVNQVVVSHDHVLAPGDEVALLPPVAGG